jgi:PAS domain S-box-containing protein
MSIADESHHDARRIVLRVSHDWSIAEFVEAQGGGLKLAKPFAPGSSLLELIHPADVEVLAHNRDWCLANKNREVTLCVRFARGQDWWVPLLTRLQSDGKPTLEMTLERDGAVAARASESQMRKVIDGSQQGISVRTLDKVLYVNSALARMLGYETIQELVAEGHMFNREAIHPDDIPVMFEHLRKRLSGEEKFSQYELRLQRRDGSYLWVETMASPIKWDGQPASLSWLMDISERKAAEEELIKSRESAERANRVKSEFLASMSHELRTPLNAILGFSEMISTEMFGKLHARYIEYASDIHQSGQHLLDLINDILDLSKLEAGKLSLKDSDFDLVRLIKNVLALVQQQADGKSLTIVEQLPAQTKIRGDLRAMKQVLLNLLSNAVKFTPEGGQISIALGGSAGGLELIVRDTGIGMTDAEIAVALEPFGQVDSLLAREQPGTGLGLPISVALMKLHGGSLRIESTPGEGTSLIVSLPAERVVAQAA